MMRSVCVAGLAALLVSAQAATLERLSLDEMTQKSTAIVRGRVTASHSGFRGPVIYTHYTIQVLEKWKGDDSQQLDVAVPGGTAKGLHQSFSGAPAITSGEEYVFFLWTGKSGLTQIIGFSQGVFSLTDDGDGGVVATRVASTEAMLDSKTGQVVADTALRMTLSDLRGRVNGALSSGPGR